MHVLCDVPRLLDVSAFRALLRHATASFDRKTDPAHIAFSVRGGSTIQCGAIDVLELRLQAMHWMHDRERRRRGIAQGHGNRAFKHRRKLQGLKARHLCKKIYAVCFALEIECHDPEFGLCESSKPAICALPPTAWANARTALTDPMMSICSLVAAP